jgi:hypothetical protein
MDSRIKLLKKLESWRVGEFESEKVKKCERVRVLVKRE